MVHRILLYSYITILSWEKCVLLPVYVDPVPVGKRFIAEGIVPQVISQPPNYTLLMTFGYDTEAFPGIVLPYIECKTKPKTRWISPSTKCLYTFILLSVDMPSENEPNTPYAEWHPHIIRNIPGLRRYAGELLRPYNIPKKPRKNSILMVALLYRQHEKLTDEMTYTQDEELIESGKFRIRTYLELQGITDPPEAGNYFYISYDMV